MSKLLSILFVGLTAFWFFFSCNEPKKHGETKQKGTIIVDVNHSAGEIYKEFNDIGVPTFFNVGKVQTERESQVEALILGKKNSKGIKLSVHPIALLSFNQDTFNHKFIVAVNPDNSKISCEYNDFLLNNYNMQATIENWFKSQCISKQCYDFKWDNVYKALLELN